MARTQEKGNEESRRGPEKLNENMVSLENLLSLIPWGALEQELYHRAGPFEGQGTCQSVKG